MPIRPNPAYGGVFQFTSDGKRDQTAIASSLTRRLKNKFQAGVTWTLMLEMKDNGTIGYGTQPANNPFDYLDGEWATSQDFQRNTIRMWGLMQLPWGINTSVTYFYGSGNRFADSIATAPFGKPGTNRLNLSATGARVAGDHDPGVGSGSVGRPGGHQLGRRDPAQRARGAAAAEGGPARHEGHQARRLGAGCSSWRRCSTSSTTATSAATTRR